MQYTIYLKTYSGCQLDCNHCMTNGKLGGNTQFNLEKTLDWFNRLHQYLPKHDSLHVELHGGEPLLADTDKLLQTVQYLRTLDRSISIGITSNLVIKLNDKLENLLLSLDGIGTSWDSNIRFANNKQYRLWKENVLYLNKLVPFSLLNISLSRETMNIPVKDLLLFTLQLQFDALAFERITLDGSTNNNLDILPTNRSINQWYLRLHQATKQLGIRDKLEIRSLEDVYAKFERGDTRCGTFCRDCEQKLFTINANGTIGGCPNTATANYYGSIDNEIAELFNQPKRIEIIVKESLRNDFCYECPVFDYCGSDCHQLQWQNRQCPAPKDLMLLLKNER